MANLKSKAVTAAVAAATAASMLVGGTLAWTSISQTAKNEAVVDINPGGRLHDDFDGRNLATAGVLANKDVYVENFGDNLTGVPIYARVRLDEYMEIGQDAGTKLDDPGRKVVVVDNTVDNTDDGETPKINDATTWETYIPGESENDTDAYTWINSDSRAYGKYWDWKMGNTDAEKIWYMPTFNKNKDSLAADINGTYDGKTAGDIVHYDDYIAWKDGDTTGGTEIYDWDDDGNDEDGTEGKGYDNGGITYVDTTPINSADVYHKVIEDGADEAHKAAQITSAATVITMAQWNALSDADKAAQGYWVYDTDGWAYWSKPIQPGETTGLLLDGIRMSKVPDDNWYYAINVVGQFATAGDLSAFTLDGEEITNDALALLAGISNTTTLTLDGADTIAPGATATYTAVLKYAGVEANPQPTTIDLSLEEAVTGVTIDGTNVTVAGDVPNGTTFTLVAKVAEASTLDAEETTTKEVVGRKKVTVVAEPVEAVLPFVSDANAALLTLDANSYNTYYRLSFADSETGETVELTDIALSGDYNTGVTYDSETNLLFVSDPNQLIALMAKDASGSDVAILIAEEAEVNDQFYFWFDECGDETNGYTIDILPSGKIYGFAKNGAGGDYTLKTADNYSLPEGVSIATVTLYNRTTSCLNILESCDFDNNRTMHLIATGENGSTPLTINFVDALTGSIEVKPSGENYNEETDTLTVTGAGTYELPISYEIHTGYQALSKNMECTIEPVDSSDITGFNAYAWQMSGEKERTLKLIVPEVTADTKFTITVKMKPSTRLNEDLPLGVVATDTINVVVDIPDTTEPTE